MLFTAPEFLFVFLPVTLFLFYFLGRQGKTRPALFLLFLASCFFYACEMPQYLLVMLGAIAINHHIAGRILKSKRKEAARTAKYWLVAGITLNLLLLAYFKYKLFFVYNLNEIFGSSIIVTSWILPLGISFHTFQQISYLVDVHRGEAHEKPLLDYFLFVTFFPQLVAGPIVYHRELFPQFTRPELTAWNSAHIMKGSAFLIMGLFKKLVLATTASDFAGPAFFAVQSGSSITFFESWSGALFYSFELYFDFSAYSDLALGLALLFNIKLPSNFNSPYKSTSLIEFWRRWHITLSRFLRDYLYIPMGGNRKGVPRVSRNLFITMLLAGLWHGAGWGFILWGAYHGFLLILNHLWRSRTHSLELAGFWRGLARTGSWLLTFFCVVIGWVIFRCSDLYSTGLMLQSMAGVNGFAWSLTDKAFFGDFGLTLESWGFSFLPPSTYFHFGGLQDLGILSLFFGVVLLFPNSNQILKASFFQNNQEDPVGESPWKPRIWQGLGLGLMLFIVLISLSQPRKLAFIYSHF